ncbi:MAG: low molecular weight protein-tyrosine-phosphatase [Propionivibrio sp.]
MIKLLMVCMGNLCRSPMAQMVTLQMARQAGMAHEIKVDSAGTRASPRKEPTDPRANAVLSGHGYALVKHKSRLVTERDFSRYDLILAMDRENLHDLMRICPTDQTHRLRLFLEFAEEVGLHEVPDPYYGGIVGFERVLDLCEAGARGLLDRLQNSPP